MTQPILYSFRRCPYAMRARMALHLAGIALEYREVALRDKPAAMLKASAKGTVPVLVLPDDKVLDESLEIMHWALPDAIWDIELVAGNDGSFKHHLDHYKYKSRYDPTAQRGDVDLNHREAAIEILATYERRFETTAFLDGTQRSLTDIAIFPFIRQFAATQPDWWKNQTELPRTRRWLSELIESDLFTQIMVKQPLWQPS